MPASRTQTGSGQATIATNAGSLAILLGRETWPATIDLADAGSDSGVIEILGIRASVGGTLPGDRMGFWATGGDVTGDGIADILVAADMARARGAGQDRGELYVIPGGANLLDSTGRVRRTIDLANPTNVLVFTIYGVDDFDHLGSAIAAADFDGDGTGDIAVSAGFARLGAHTGLGQFSGAANGGDGPNNDRDRAGEVYIVYGRSLADWQRTPLIELTNPPAADVSVFYGQREMDFFGEDVAAGDFDGDGRPSCSSAPCSRMLRTAPGPAATAGSDMFSGDRASVEARRLTWRRWANRHASPGSTGSSARYRRRFDSACGHRQRWPRRSSLREPEQPGERHGRAGSGLGRAI